jgi:radical SAM protein with 4Fe4S-binding SPASM domain
MCPLSLPDYRKIVGYSGHLDMDLYTKIVSDIKKMGKLKSLKLYSDGEPLLNKNIAKMVRPAKINDIAERIEITTNASLLKKEISLDLIESGLDYLRISIASVSERRRFEINQSKISVRQIFDNIKNFKRLRDKLGRKLPFIYVKMIDTFGPENEIFKNMYKGVADEVCIESPMNWNGQRNFISNLYPNKKINKDLFPPAKKLKKVCPFPFYSLVIKCNGDVVACCVDWSRQTKIGNLKGESLSEVWDSQRLREFRKIHLEGRREENESCRNCTYLYTSPDNIDNLPDRKISEILNK